MCNACSDSVYIYELSEKIICANKQCVNENTVSVIMAVIGQTDVVNYHKETHMNAN